MTSGEPVLNVRGIKATEGAYLQCFYRHKPVYCELDSGSECSLAPKKLFKTSDIVPSSQQVIAIGGSQIPIIGQTTMILYVSGVKVLTPVLITDAVENIVLGLPWLKMNNVLWNVKEQWVEMYQRRIPLHSRPKRDTTIHSSRNEIGLWTVVARLKEKEVGYQIWNREDCGATRWMEPCNDCR